MKYLRLILIMGRGAQLKSLLTQTLGVSCHCYGLNSLAGGLSFALMCFSFCSVDPLGKERISIHGDPTVWKFY